MKKLILTVMILSFSFCGLLPVCAKDRVVANVGKTAIVSEGLYFNICDVSYSKNFIDITVQAKNKSMFSQALYIELIDDTGKSFAPLNKDSINIFGPLKFNKTVTQKLSFDVPVLNKNFKLAVYSKDIFKKNKKELITKMSLKEAKKELETKKLRQ